MNLLIITQKVDRVDDNLSFFHRWIEKFSKKADKVYVICLSSGKFNLPANVSVFTLGKEKGYSKIRQFFRLQKFLFKLLPETDGVFIHMCPIYALSSLPLARFFGKKMILWYTHKSVNWQLKLAEKCVAEIITASEESCRLKNRKKIKVLGHGIDTDLFKPGVKTPSANKKFMIMSAGRIVQTKDFQTLIEAADYLVNRKNIRDFQIKIIGSAVLDSSKEYLRTLKDLVGKNKLENYLEFIKGVPNEEMPRYYQESDLVINLSHTGSIDKVVLEAMASGCLVLTCNEAFQKILDGEYLFEKKNHRDLAEKIINLRNVKSDEALREFVVKNHNLDNLIEKICRRF